MGSFNPFASAFQSPYGLPKPDTVPPEIGYSTYTCDVPDEEKLPHELYPYTFPPPTYQTFRPTQWITTPIIGASATILTLQAKVGWDGVVLKIAHGFGGPGFTQGSGDLTWNLSINGNQPVPNFGAMTSAIGDSAHAEDISPGFILKSGQTLIYTVANVAQVTGGALVFATLQGYFWRVQTGKVGST